MDKLYLTELWQNAPLSWAIIRDAECRKLSAHKFTHPVLEIGCGDGLVSKLIFDDKQNVIDVGIDINKEELRRAQITRVYKKLVSVDVNQMPFKSNSFATIFSNGVLEHVPDLDRSLKEIARTLKPNGILITTSPTYNYTQLLFYYRFFKFLGLNVLAAWYGNLINKLFDHRSLLNNIEWRDKLKKAGLKLEKFEYYNNSKIVLIHDLCLPFSIFTKFIKKHTDSMILFPKLRNIWVKPVSKLIFRMIKTDNNSYLNNASIFIEAKKV